MNYRVLGIAAGALLVARSQLNRKVGLPSIRGIIETAHYLPGRMRLVVPSLVGSPESVDALKKHMQPLDPIQSIQASPVSGSVVICYDPQAVEAEVIFGATARILGLDEKIEASPNPVLWRELKTAGQAVDQAIFSRSAGFVDVKTLVTLGLIGTVTYRMATQPSRMAGPGTVTLAWWVFNLIFMRGAAP